MTDSQEAPGGLEQVRVLLNTLDVEGGRDALETPAETAAWLHAAGLGDAATADEAGWRWLRALRDGLRDLLAGGDPAALNATLAARPARVRFEPGGGWSLTADDPLTAVGARMVAAVAAADAAGTLDRLKLCGNDACAWAFYDRSRNRSRRWCSMAVCGNRIKARTHRQRH
jgi:predicted RNA-binding Zn ribbon-like protein